MSIKDWIPLFQSALWPICVIAVVCVFRNQLQRILTEISDRIKSGDTLEASPKGLKLSRNGPEIDDSQDTNVSATENPPEELLDEEIRRAHAPTHLSIAYSATRAPDLDKHRYKYFRLRFWIESNDAAVLNRVESVTYFLHPTFRNPVRTVKSNNSQFTLKTVAWGEFNLKAIVRFADQRAPVELEKYIAFEPATL